MAVLAMPPPRLVASATTGGAGPPPWGFAAARAIALPHEGKDENFPALTLAGPQASTVKLVSAQGS
eukprot:9082492-Pyramimonas_sp.AAC.1